nr:ribonucleotide reductase subunit 1 [Human alphaherpesvirus 3]
MEFKRIFNTVHDIINRLCQHGYKEYIIPPESTTPVELMEYISTIVSKLKAVTRQDERVYRCCGELIHCRINLRSVSMETWLTSPILCLTPRVRQAIEGRRDEIRRAILEPFLKDQYPALATLGLQSALKYEDFYLTKLEEGKLESLCQLFLRLAATVTTEIVNLPKIATLIPGINDGYTWTDVCRVFFTALACQKIVPATPVMMFLGRETGATASCYLMDPESITVGRAVRAITGDVGTVLQSRGGVGISLQSLNLIPTENQTKGLLAVLKLLDCMVMAINSDCERPTGVCVYIEPWHVDLQTVLATRGMLVRDEIFRCDNIFCCLWTPDLFFERYLSYLKGASNVQWTLFDNRADILRTLHGEAFTSTYLRLEREGLGVSSVPIQDIAFTIIRSAAVTGSPFLMFKDACNRNYHMNTQGNAITGSNLCTEIVQKADAHQHGVCNLASINLTTCLSKGPVSFNLNDLQLTARTTVIFLNGVLAAGNFPCKKSCKGVKNNRSLGIGIQGLHTTCLRLGFDLTSQPARRLNVQIAELMLYETMKTSMEMCKIGGLAPFKGFTESKYAKGWLHQDGFSTISYLDLPWCTLRDDICAYGLYNSQFLALMPTVSSAQVTECSEGFSPIYNNMFSKVTTSGELLRPNLDLMDELRDMYSCEEKRLEVINILEKNQWSVIRSFGCLSNSHPLLKYKTAFEYEQEDLVDMCAERAPFIDQSQSMTLFIEERPDGTIPASKIMNLLIRAYKAGLKTGMYYCKIRKATNSGLFAGGELTCTSCAL